MRDSFCPEQEERREAERKRKEGQGRERETDENDEGRVGMSGRDAMQKGGRKEGKNRDYRILQ